MAGGSHKAADHINAIRLVRAKELANMLSVSEKTLYEWAKYRKIPGVVRLHNTVRFDLDKVMSWVRESTKESLSEYNPFARPRAPGRRAR